VTSPEMLASALRNHADGLYCLEAAAELLITQTWLHRTDFTHRFVFLAVGQGLIDGRPIATVDWSAAITALDAGELPCSGGERRMLRLTASLAGGVPIDLGEALSGIDQGNLDRLVAAIRHACGRRPSPAGRQPSVISPTPQH
jgi:hypothetical protein